MKILSYAVGDQESFGLLVEDGVLDLATRLGVPTLRAALAADILHQAAEFAGSPADHPLERIKFLPVVPDPAHIWCMAINYQDHIEEIKDRKSHTSELQSLMRISFAVFSLKKKLSKQYNNT